MTPKDKAKELIEKFHDLPIILSTSKDCALIAVQEILDSYTNENINGFIISDKIILYWKQVKQEINNL
jgi:hypothetical protein